MTKKQQKFAVFTMDLESLSDTGCIRESNLQLTEDMLDGLDEYISILDKYNIKATLFAMCDAAESIREKLSSYLHNGHDLALHGNEHTAPIQLNNEDFRRSIQAAKEKMEHLFHVPIRGYRAPFFGLDNERLEILADLGFRYDSSKFDFPNRVFAANIDMSKFSRITDHVFQRDKFFEFAIPCQDFMGMHIPICGGGYARMSNWTFFVSILHQYLAHSNYYVFYLHPFEVSREKMPPTPHLKSRDQYYLRAGIRSFPHKIELIIRMLKKCGYEFITFDQLSHRLEQGKVTF